MKKKHWNEKGKIISIGRHFLINILKIQTESMKKTIKQNENLVTWQYVKLV